MKVKEKKVSACLFPLWSLKKIVQLKATSTIMEGQVRRDTRMKKHLFLFKHLMY